MSEPRRTPPNAGKPGGPQPSELAGLGLQFVAVLLAFLFAGKWLDERLGTAPWLLMLGVFLGFALSLLYIYRKLVIDPRQPPRGGG